MSGLLLKDYNLSEQHPEMFDWFPGYCYHELSEHQEDEFEGLNGFQLELDPVHFLAGIAAYKPDVAQHVIAISFDGT